MSDPSRRILLSRLLTHSGDQAWDFALPLALIQVFPGAIGLVSLFYFVVRLLHTILVTPVCSLIDRVDRRTAVRLGVGAQTFGIVLAVACVLSLAYLRPGAAPWGSPTTSLLFIGAMAAGVIASLGGTMMDVAISQDWLPHVVPRERLAATNSRLKQIDLATEVSAPVVAGLLFALSLDSVPLFGFLLVAAWNVVSFLPELALLESVLGSNAALRKPAPAPQARQSVLDRLSAGWRDFVAQPAALSMIAYALLWLTVLSPHGVLLTAWLRSQGHLSEAGVGIFRGLGALFGLVATVVFPWLLARTSLVSASRALIVFEAACVLGAAAAYASGASFAVAFLGLVLLSRIGLYGFSLGETEIRQVTIDPAVRGRVNGFANALTSIATLGLYGAGAALEGPEQFGYLVYGSAACVTAGAVVFVAWSATVARKSPELKCAS